MIGISSHVCGWNYEKEVNDWKTKRPIDSYHYKNKDQRKLCKEATMQRRNLFEILNKIYSFFVKIY